MALGNMATIFTKSGRAAHEFRERVEAGMTGINVPIAQPFAFFPFSGWKGSFYGDLHVHGTDGIEFFGHSFICDPFGRILAEAGTEPAVLVATCDRALIESTRRNWPFLRDRRIDAYAPILNRYIG